MEEQAYGQVIHGCEFVKNPTRDSDGRAMKDENNDFVGEKCGKETDPYRDKDSKSVQFRRFCRDCYKVMRGRKYERINAWKADSTPEDLQQARLRKLANEKLVAEAFIAMYSVVPSDIPESITVREIPEEHASKLEWEVSVSKVKDKTDSLSVFLRKKGFKKNVFSLDVFVPTMGVAFVYHQAQVLAKKLGGKEKGFESSLKLVEKKADPKSLKDLQNSLM